MSFVMMQETQQNTTSEFNLKSFNLETLYQDEPMSQGIMLWMERW